MKHPKHINVGQVIGIHSWLVNNPGKDLQPLAHYPAGDVELVQTWFSTAMQSEISDLMQPGHTMVSVGAVLCGLVVGIGLTSVALTYTGAHPVNLLLLLALLVGLPGITLILSILARLLLRHRGPGVGETLTWRLSRLSGAYADFLSTNLWRYGTPLYWHTQCYFQLFTLAVLGAGLLTFISLITFSDLAFGWSSTLQLDAHTVYSLTEILSLPWQTWLPIAHPSLELVEASRFYRMNPTNNPELLGQWWPFVGMAILVWGIAPRLVMLIVARRWVKSTTRSALLNHPEVTALIRRLRQSDTLFASSQTGTREDAVIDPVEADHAYGPADGVITWNGADPGPAPSASANSEADAGAVLRIGTGVSTEMQRELLQALPDEIKRLRIVVKGWEPPMLEFLDFVQLIRNTAGADAEIAIQPQALVDQPLSESELLAWRSILAKLQDAKVYVEANT